MPFNDDRVPDSDGTHPPLAWILVWGGTYSNILGQWNTWYNGRRVCASLCAPQLGIRDVGCATDAEYRREGSVGRRTREETGPKIWCRVGIKQSLSQSETTSFLVENHRGGVCYDGT